MVECPAEITQPFIDLVRAPRALWGVNLAYTIEGLSYFGILTYLAIHFSDFIFKGVEHADIWSHEMVMVSDCRHSYFDGSARIRSG